MSNDPLQYKTVLSQGKILLFCLDDATTEDTAGDFLDSVVGRGRKRLAVDAHDFASVEFANRALAEILLGVDEASGSAIQSSMKSPSLHSSLVRRL
jgi:hypothetical protein